jgi:hypothetical protein
MGAHRERQSSRILSTQSPRLSNTKSKRRKLASALSPTGSSCKGKGCRPAMGAKCYVVLPARRSKRSVVTPFPLCMRVPFSLFCHQRFGNDREMGGNPSIEQYFHLRAKRAPVGERRTRNRLTGARFPTSSPPRSSSSNGADSMQRDMTCPRARRNVKSAALDHGFWHLGRFAHEYRNLFGERPSETLSRPHQ